MKGFRRLELRVSCCVVRFGLCISGCAFRVVLFRVSGCGVHQSVFPVVALGNDFILASIFDQYSDSIQITTHPDHVIHCKTASGTNWSKGPTGYLS